MNCTRFLKQKVDSLIEAFPKSLSSKHKTLNKKSGFQSQGKAIVNVLSLLNNTFVTLTTLDGKTIAWSSGGTEGFKGSRRSTSYAAQLSGETIGKKAIANNIHVVTARIKGPGYGKAASLRGLKMAGVKIIHIQDVSPLPFNGCRPKKKRRV
jgi:small subunit ribosomal protein S11